MQRTFIAIALALTLSCACADTSYATTNYVKDPQPVVQNAEINFTSANGTFGLESINAGELDIIGANVTYPVQTDPSIPINYTASSWVATYRKLDAKALSASTNTSVSFPSPPVVSFSNGYALAFKVDNDTYTNNIPQISIYQTKITGGNTTRFNVSSNTNSGVNPAFAKVAQIGKNVYIFYYTKEGSSQINITTYAIGATARGSVELTLTTAFNKSLNVVWGEALGNNQLYANWVETSGDSTVLKYATIDVSKSGNVSSTAATAWNNTYTCSAFSTDKKHFGDLCYFANGTGVNDTVNYYARFNGTAFIPLTNVSQNATLARYSAVYPYGPYLSIFYKNTANSVTTYSYDIFNFDAWNVTKARTTFLTVQGYEADFYRVVSGGLYTLTYQKQTTNTTIPTYSDVKVGLVLGSSYLTSVLGFIMTIVAGVLLF